MENKRLGIEADVLLLCTHVYVTDIFNWGKNMKLFQIFKPGNYYF